MDIAAEVQAKARAAKEASRVLALAPTRTKNEVLSQMARGLEEKAATILEANRADLARARSKGLTRAFVDRLTLTDGRIEEMATGVRQVAALPDPVGEVVETWHRPNGLEISRVRVPLGVIGFIYESRPNVTADAAALCLKSGNAVVLRGGSEAIESNTMIAQLLAKSVEKAGLPADVIQYVDTPDRAAVMALLTLDRDLDLIIPRGGEELVRLVTERATVPVLKHDKGLCHVFVDEGADLGMAVAIAVNAKAHRVSVCNAMETLLVHAAIAPRYLPVVAARLGEAGVEIRGDERTRAFVPAARVAEESDWDTEYLDSIVAVKVVDSLDEAMAHIRRHGSGLAEAIVTSDLRRARRFTHEVDAAAVLVNASTRLVDGSQFGMGAEMGISTSRLHARGPVGVRELTTTKFVVLGDGQIRE
ncbi:MAG: glutamate-5-semialdehyde dehydrogenase [Elusimicrobia bacterium GWA2_69_24]|nr:MAG: glutamate-5-semialdehyde dehydrogenase [Candidatus Rokubacteria bacterium GWF2_70_14]OGR59119.1 MAG: glutamate-5-semialdehyde dehydrogenase [Elusimicrobia bacterium GWA2_69_24]HAM53981.1 glutamate-5-semialdehyde dehydrogenase [Candidatus Rokubacteria bacterium]